MIISSEATTLRGRRGLNAAGNKQVDSVVRTVKRRRECEQCKTRFTTYELPEKQYKHYLAFMRAVDVQAAIAAGGVDLRKIMSDVLKGMREV